MKTYKLIICLGLLVALSACTHHRVSNQNAAIVEVVVWQAKKGFSELEIKRRALAVNNFLDHQNGFLYRELAKNSKGEWLDTVYWTDMTAAKRAQKNSLISKDCAPFFEVINMDSMKIFHFDSIEKHHAKNEG